VLLGIDAEFYLFFAYLTLELRGSVL